MTVAVELDWAWHSQNPKSSLPRCNIVRMCSMLLPSNFKLYQYLAKSNALHGSFGDSEYYDTMPAPFLLEVLRNCAPLRRKVGAELERELRDPCSFHEHGSGSPKAECKQRQHQDGPFYNSFLSACMQSVYAHDKALATRAQARQEDDIKAEESMAA